MAEPDTHEQRLAALMRSAQAGDADAYVALMQELAVRVRQIVRHRRAFLERADVEDLVQDVVLVRVRRRSDLRRDTLMPWVLGTDANRIADACAGMRGIERTKSQVVGGAFLLKILATSISPAARSIGAGARIPPHVCPGSPAER